MQWNNDPLPRFKSRRFFSRTWRALPAAFALLLTPAMASEKSAAHKSELGLWVWQHQSVREDDMREGLIEFCSTHNINRILIQVRFEGDSGQRQFADAEAFTDLLQRASKAGIAIEALDGAHNMGLEERRADTLERLDAVLAFQKSLPEDARFAGVHYDIEPYLNPRWRAGDEKGVAKETLETMAEIRARITPETGLSLAYDIPAWYDSRGESLAIDFQGQKKNFQEHIQDLSDYVGVMSYRRKATGSNSIMGISAGELAYGTKIGKKVYPAMETGRLKEEAELSFYGTGAATFLNALKEVQEEGRNHPSFGGVFLHHYGSLKELLSDKKD